MARRAREHRHELDRGSEKACQAIRRDVERKPSAQVRLLAGDADGAVATILTFFLPKFIAKKFA